MSFVMILTTYINIKITKNNIFFYKQYKNDISIGDEISIPIDYIHKKSKLKIDIKCDICEKENNIHYYAYTYNLERYGFYTCKKCSNIKRIKTNQLKYGVDNISKLDITKDKMKKTNLERYGTDNPSKNKEILNKVKKTKLKKYGDECYFKSPYYKENYSMDYFLKYGVDISVIKLKFKEYRNNVNYYTKINKKELLLNWDGYDFYDNEYIKDNFNLDYRNKNYPTIDHKISVFFGFNNNIPPNKIAEINNLCITKKSLNSKKNRNNYEE